MNTSLAEGLRLRHCWDNFAGVGGRGKLLSYRAGVMRVAQSFFQEITLG